MMSSIVSVFFSFFRSWFTYVTVSNPVSKEHYAAHNLFQATFRIPQSERGQHFLVLKKYFNFLKTLFFSGNNSSAPFIFSDSDGIFIYDVFRKQYESRKDYVNYFSKENVAGGIFKNELYFCNSKLTAFTLFVLSLFFLPLLFIHSLFKKDKAPIANIFKEILETINLVGVVKKHQIKKIYFFCIYEKDANVCTLILQSNSVFIAKIPSEVPIYIWNKIIVADKLCVCNGYQYDELKEFQKSLFINETEFWGPETVLENIEKYKLPVETKKQTIGFYSTGAWVRKLENHIDQGIDMQQMETQVKMAIRDFCKLNPEYTLMIFLHPRERWEKYMSLTHDKYKNDFEGVKFQLMDSGVKSSSSFENADLGIAFQSTIVYERLYYGFKTLLMPVGTEYFPIKSSNMKNICSFTETDLFQKIQTNIKLNNTQFFENNGIKHFSKFLYN